MPSVSTVELGTGDCGLASANIIKIADARRKKSRFCIKKTFIDGFNPLTSSKDENLNPALLYLRLA
jgi:hypothetical protein